MPRGGERFRASIGFCNLRVQELNAEAFSSKHLETILIYSNRRLRWILVLQGIWQIILYGHLRLKVEGTPSKLLARRPRRLGLSGGSERKREL